MPAAANTYEAVDDLQSSFNTYWATQPIRPLLGWDGVAVDAVKDDLTITSSDPEVQGEGYVLVSVNHADGIIAAQGTRFFRQIGVFSAAVFVATNRGRVRTAGKIADQALAFMQQEQPNTFAVFRSPRINEIGPDGRWWRVDVLTDFEYDIFRS